MAPNEKPNHESDVVADFSDPERLYKNRDKYPEMIEEIENVFGEVTVETCRKALKQAADDFNRLENQESSSARWNTLPDSDSEE